MTDQNGVPLYRQVKDHILEGIRTGVLKPGMKIESENDLVKKLSVSRMTVNRALRELTAEGRLTRIQGSGTFIAQIKPQSALLEIRSIADEIKAVTANLDDDDQFDLLLYFQSVNCTGHNGGTKFFARIIYANGTTMPDLMDLLINNILIEYEQKRKTDDSLEPVTSNYLETTTTITGYNNGLHGSFSLYTEEDAHCCPTYNGSYLYNVQEDEMEIQIRLDN